LKLGPAQFFAGLATVGAIALLIVPPPDGVSPGTMHAAAIVTLAIGLWATGVLPEYLTALLFFLLAVVFAVAPRDVVFSGFSAGATWLLFGGLVIGLAVERTGFGARVSRRAVGLLTGSYLGILYCLVIGGTLLAFLVPSAAGRVVITLPFVLKFAEQLGFREGSNGRTAMALALGMGTVFPTFSILPAAVPNMGLVGAAESIYGIQFTYGLYLAQNFPVIGIPSMLFLPLALRFVYPDTPRPRFETAEWRPLGGGEIRLTIILLMSLALWLSDAWHGVSPAWVALGAAVLLVLPRIGVIAPEELVRGVNYGPWFYIAALVGMGAVVHNSGLGDAVGRLVLSVIPLSPGNDAQNFVAMVALGMGMGLVSTMPGQPGIMTPLAQPIADATGWPLMTVLMAQVPSWGLALVPYQIPPLVVTLAMARLSIGKILPVMWLHVAFIWAVTMPLTYVWWKATGFIP
jgi:di/tricarboxylate transporter